MKKFRIFYLIYLIVITVIGCVPSKEANTGMVKVGIYFADKQMMRLVPVDYYIKDGTPTEKCRKIIYELTKSRDYDTNIRRLLPGEESVSVKVENNSAVVNIRTQYFGEFEKVKWMENLIVFQIVNSLATVDGISKVEFLLDGKKEKDFFGYIDMREYFVPDYYV